MAFRDLDLDPDDELIARFYHDVLAVSFSPDELDDAEGFSQSFRNGGGAHVLASVAVGPDGELLGGVVGEVYAAERVLLLAYLAVRPDQRGRGLGTRLMEHVAPRWYAHPDVELALAEVHDPRPWANVAGDDPVARLRLYERMGARVLAVPFVQPALGPGRARVPGFLLLVFHINPEAELQREGGSEVRSDLVARFVRRYFEVAEGLPDAADSQLNALLARIEEQPTIRILPIAEYDRVPLLA